MFPIFFQSLMGLEKLRCDVPCGTTQSYFHPTAKGVKGTKVKIFFQGLHMKHVIFVLVYTLVFWISHLILHVRYKYILITN